MIEYYLIFQSIFRDFGLFFLLFFSFFNENRSLKSKFKDMIKRLSPSKRLEIFELQLVKLSILELLIALPRNLPVVHKLFCIFKVFKNNDEGQKILRIIKEKIVHINSLKNNTINLEKISLGTNYSQDALKNFYLHELKKHNLDFSSWILILYGSRLLLAFFIPMLLLFTNIHHTMILPIIVLVTISFIAFIDSKELLVFYLGKNRKFINKRGTNIFTKAYIEIDIKETKFTYAFFKDIIFYLRKKHSLLLSYLKALMKQNLPNIKEKNNIHHSILNKKLKKGVLCSRTYTSFFNIVLHSIMLPDNKKFFKLSAILANWRKKLFLEFVQLVTEILSKKSSYLEERLIIINSYRFKMSILGYMISIIDGLLLALSPVYSVIWSYNFYTIYKFHLSLFSFGIEYVLYNIALVMIMIDTFSRISSFKETITIAIISLVLFNITFVIFSMYFLSVFYAVQ